MFGISVIVSLEVDLISSKLNLADNEVMNSIKKIYNYPLFKKKNLQKDRFIQYHF